MRPLADGRLERSKKIHRNQRRSSSLGLSGEIDKSESKQSQETLVSSPKLRRIASVSGSLSRQCMSTSYPVVLPLMLIHGDTYSL